VRAKELSVECEQFEKNTTRVSLHSSSCLPIIVAMKIWFRIGPDRGNEQDGPQPPERYCSADSTVRFLDPFTLLALPKEGNTCEGSRFSRARLLQAQAGGRPFSLDCFPG
jgi:hypothetical protein